MRRLILIFFMAFFFALPNFAQNTNAVAVISQRFEGGEMIYRRDNGDIYVISNNSGQWWLYASTVYGRLPENQESAPRNRRSPANGFGRIWANNSTIHTELGRAVLPEIALEMQFTNTATGDLYLTRLNGIILHLATDETWETVSSIPNRSGSTINSFVVSPQSIAQGNSLSISWDASGSDLVQIVMRDTDKPDTENVAFYDSLPLSGSLEWTIPETVSGDIEVTIWLINRVNSTSPLCCYDWLTSLSRRVDVYQDASFRLETYAAYQAYQNGFMIWREDTGDVRIFYNSGAWQQYPEHFYSLNSDNLWPIPEGCVEVVNAFGKIWGAYSDIRDAIGCATSTEQGYTLVITGDANGDFHYTLPNSANIKISGNIWQS